MVEFYWWKFKVAIPVILQIRSLLYERNSTSLQVEADGKHLIETCDVADEFSKQLQPLSCILPHPFVVFWISNLVPLSELNTFKAIKSLRSYKFVGVHDIPGFIINGCILLII
jgi:hypothetical protein